MTAAIAGEPLNTIRLDSKWGHQFEFTGEDFTGQALSFVLVSVGRPVVGRRFTAGSGVSLIGKNRIACAFVPSDLADLRPGDYAFQVQIGEDDAADTILVGQVPVVRGLSASLDPDAPPLLSASAGAAASPVLVVPPASTRVIRGGAMMGLSAYQLAVNLGLFEGTEAEYAALPVAAAEQIAQSVEAAQAAAEQAGEAAGQATASAQAADAAATQAGQASAAVAEQLPLVANAVQAANAAAADVNEAGSGVLAQIGVAQGVAVDAVLTSSDGIVAAIGVAGAGGVASVQAAQGAGVAAIQTEGLSQVAQVQAAAGQAMFVDIATGRAAVADGGIFVVRGAEGSGVYATSYRRLSSTTQTAGVEVIDKSVLDAGLSGFIGTGNAAEPFPDDGGQGEFLLLDGEGRIIDRLPRPASEEGTPLPSDPAFGSVTIGDGITLEQFLDDGSQGGLIVLDGEGRIIALSGDYDDSALMALIATLTGRIDTSLDAAGLLKAERFNVEYLRDFHRRLSLLRRGVATQAILAVCGDSWSTNDYYVWKLTKMLHDTYGFAGVGFVGFGFNAGNANDPHGSASADQTTTLTGGWTSDHNQTSSPDLATAKSSNVGAKIKVTAPAGHNAVALFHRRANGSAIRYRFNGGAWTALALDGEGQDITMLAGTPPGALTLEMEVVSGTVTLCGCDLRSAQPGVRVHKLGAPSSRSDHWLSTWPGVAFSIEEQAAGWAALTPHAVQIMLGTNDQVGANPLGYGWNMATLVGRWRAAVPLIDVSLVAPYENSAERPTPMTAYQAQLAQVAQAMGCAFLNLQRAAGDLADYGHGGPRPWIDPSLTHPSSDGGDMIADRILSLLES